MRASRVVVRAGRWTRRRTCSETRRLTAFGRGRCVHARRSHEDRALPDHPPSWVRAGSDRVYLAHDDDLDRPVAIKVPNPERITRPEDVEAYLNEARILARLDHPNIVPVFDVGRTEDGLCFVVSKLVEGSDLAVRIGQARPSFRDSAELVATIADALALRPHPRAGPPGHQARQHPDRRFGQTLCRRLRARPQGRGLRQGWRDWLELPPT